MIKRLLISILVCSVLATTGCTQKEEQTKDQLTKIKERGELTVGVKFDSKPFGFVQDGKLQGYDIDIAHLIAKRLLGNEKLVKFIEVNASNRITKLNSGEVDILIATMTITPQRLEVIDFSIPYYYAGQAIMVRKGTSINSVTDLNGRRVIVVLGTTSEKNVRYLAPEVRLLGFPTYKAAFNGFLNHKAEAMSADDSILAGFVMDNPEFTILPQRYTQEGYAIAIRNGEENVTLKNEINLAINELRAKGYLNRLKSQWLPSSSKKFKNAN